MTRQRTAAGHRAGAWGCGGWTGMGWKCARRPARRTGSHPSTPSLRCDYLCFGRWIRHPPPKLRTLWARTAGQNWAVSRP